MVGITGLIGLRPRADDLVEVNPLVPEGAWAYFCLDRVRYHGCELTILYDKNGARYGRGKGLHVLCNGRELSKWDLSGAHPAKLLAKFPGTGKWSNLRADGGFAYMQSTTDGVILKMNLTTGAITRLVERHHPVPNPDKWDEDPVRWQLKSPFSIDGQFLYYLDGDAIRRVAK